MIYSVWSMGVESDEVLSKKEYSTKHKAIKGLIVHSIKQLEDFGGTLTEYMGINQIVHTAPDGTRTIFYIEL